MEENETLYSGIAIGGPLDGDVVEGRFSGGIVFVSKPENKAWVYDFYPDLGRFYARPPTYDPFWVDMSPEQKLDVVTETTLAGIDPVRELDQEKIIQAANSRSYEVRALPYEEGEY